MYSCAPYATASGFVELPYLFLQSAVFMPISYWMIGFEATAAKFFFFWLVFLMALTLNTFLGQLLVMVTPSQQVGQLMGSGRGLPQVPSFFCFFSVFYFCGCTCCAALLMLDVCVAGQLLVSVSVTHSRVVESWGQARITPISLHIWCGITDCILLLACVQTSTKLLLALLKARHLHLPASASIVSALLVMRQQ